MMCSSSLLVIIITGTWGWRALICVKVSSPLRPGIISSRKTMSTLLLCSSSSSKASLPLITGMTS